MTAETFSLSDYLGTLPYFRGVDAALLSALAVHGMRRRLDAGELILTEGEPCYGMCIIEAGRVKIFKLNPDGNEHVLLILGERDTFNDIAALDNGTNPANAAALSEAIVWVLPAKPLQDLIAQDSRVALNVIRALSGRVRGLVQQIENLALYSVLSRVARFLLKQLDEPALSGPGVTRAAIAAHLATTPQTISTVLKSLEEMGAIEFNRHQIVIVREDLLRSIAML